MVVVGACNVSQAMPVTPTSEMQCSWHNAMSQPRHVHHLKPCVCHVCHVMLTQRREKGGRERELKERAKAGQRETEQDR